MTGASGRRPAGRGDALTRPALRQMVWLGAGATGAFLALLVLLAWASSLTGGGAAAGRAFDVEARAITYYLRNEPPQLDSTRQADQISGIVLGHTQEGLTRYDVRNEIAPGVAERWEIDEDKATFWLRSDARWSDGKPVTAHDFVFAWRKIVDPANASLYAFILYSVVNGEAINAGELPVESLGVRALADDVLEVDLARPVPFFDKLTAFYVLSPIRQDFYESRGGRYAADASDHLANGPFMITRWVHGASLVLKKNPNYWNRDEIWLETIDFAYFTEDVGAHANLFKDGAIVGANLGADQLEDAMARRWQIGSYDDGGLFFLDFNFRPDRPTRNYHLRRAMQLVNDPSELVNKVIALPGYRPGVSLFPSWLRGIDGPFRSEYPPPAVTTNVERAREHLELARRELRLETFPPLVLLADDTPVGRVTSEYYQNLFMRTLGLEIRLDRQNFRQRIDKMTVGDFDIVTAGWGPDYNDPLTYGDLYASWNGNNRGRYDNPELDRQVRMAENSLDPGVRMRAFAEIQRIMIEDAVHLPNYERGIVYVQVPELKGVVHRALSPDVDFTHAYLEASQ